MKFDIIGRVLKYILFNLHFKIYLINIFYVYGLAFYFPFISVFFVLGATYYEFNNALHLFLQDQTPCVLSNSLRASYAALFSPCGCMCASRFGDVRHLCRYV